MMEEDDQSEAYQDQQEESVDAQDFGKATDKPNQAARQPVDASYIHVFLMKYVCPVPECGGTLAPVPGSDRAECNMCGAFRDEQDFLREVQEYC